MCCDVTVMYILGTFIARVIKSSAGYPIVRYMNPLTPSISYHQSIYHLKFIYPVSCTYHLSLSYLLSTYLSSTCHQFIIYLSSIYYLAIIYLLSSYRISIISLSYIYHLPIIYLSSIYLSSICHPSLINLLSIYHICIAEEDDVQNKEESHPNLHGSQRLQVFLVYLHSYLRHVGHRQERSANALTTLEIR